LILAIKVSEVLGRKIEDVFILEMGSKAIEKVDDKRKE
jgi:DNA-binding XRE family transcriptional regulator